VTEASRALPTAPPAGRRLRLLAALAWRESRTARRRLLLYMSSISLGVAALVAIDSFAGNVTRSVREQSRGLVGGDVSFTAREPTPAPLSALLDSLDRHGGRSARQVSFASMAVSPRSGRTRLAQVRAVSSGYPIFGQVTTAPAGRYASLQGGANALVDESLLIALDARVGDTLSLGYGRFAVTGVLREVPGDPGIAAIIGPRIFIPERYVAETQLLGFGSRAEYESVAAYPEGTAVARAVQPYRARLDSARVRVRTVAESESNLTNAIQRLADFLGVVGLVALMLGGVGVASGVSAFVARKIDTVAVLRCLGATGPQVLAIYGSQAALMGLAGAAVGALLGIGIQFLLPLAVADLLPVDVAVRLEPRAILTGLGIGGWVALAFALRPLLALRRVSPLQALRRDAAGIGRRGWRDPYVVLVDVALVGSVLGIAMARATTPRQGAALAGGIAAVLLVLYGAAALLTWIARRAPRPSWPYTLRQGIANLHRPGSQTRAVVLSLGFGAFLVSTLYLVQANLLREFRVTAGASRGNLVFFDVQQDQAPGLDSLIRAARRPVLQRTPIVVMRIASIGGFDQAALTSPKDPDHVKRAQWAVRREYRSTYRDSLLATERITAGRPFARRGTGQPSDTGEVSLDAGVAKELAVKLGDVIVWNVQGALVPTRVTSFRDVVWTRFEPNFFAVFDGRSLESAPQQFVLLTDARDPAVAARLQRDVVARYPNVSSIDLTLILRTVEDVVHKVSLAVRFLAIFSLLMGVPVLFGAVSATRRQRLREGVLLKTLGATRAQIRRILAAEYALLGAMGALCGMALSFAGAWALTHFVFESGFTADWPSALAIAGGMLLLTLIVGLVTSREVYRETPMVALRQE
jgi:putative ABC transport system permease protein